MSNTHDGKSSDKPRQRGRKSGQRGQKAGRQRDGDQIDPTIASADIAGSGAVAPVEKALPVEQSLPAEQSVQVEQPLQAEQSLIAEVEPASAVATEDVTAGAAPTAPTGAISSGGETVPVNVQTIANAYRDYTRKSFQVNRSFVEKLMSVRSFDKAVEVQTDYATQAYANFVAESQKICGLYSELARQTLKPWKASSPR
jgi:hypothetical protein